MNYIYNIPRCLFYMNLYYYFILFLIYSFIGWIIEVINFLIHSKKFVNRGFLIGPWLPIYGTGAILVIILLNKYLEMPIVLFVMSMVICALIEYFSSFIMEKIFNTRWWDYSSKKFNINGRICLETMIPFGIACLILMYVINPVIGKMVFNIPYYIARILAILLGSAFLIDFVVSFKIISKFKTAQKEIRKDSTEKITEYVKNEILKKKKVLYTRLVNAFPKLKILKNNKK